MGKLSCMKGFKAMFNRGGNSKNPSPPLTANEELQQRQRPLTPPRHPAESIPAPHMQTRPPTRNPARGQNFHVYDFANGHPAPEWRGRVEGHREGTGTALEPVLEEEVRRAEVGEREDEDAGSGEKDAGSSEGECASTDSSSMASEEEDAVEGAGVDSSATGESDAGAEDVTPEDTGSNSDGVANEQFKITMCLCGLECCLLGGLTGLCVHEHKEEKRWKKSKQAQHQQQQQQQQAQVQQYYPAKPTTVYNPAPSANGSTGGVSKLPVAAVTKIARKPVHGRKQHGRSNGPKDHQQGHSSEENGQYYAEGQYEEGSYVEYSYPDANANANEQDGGYGAVATEETTSVGVVQNDTSGDGGFFSGGGWSFGFDSFGSD
ncbi:MAG: hypothetical protein M1831_002263 [Alyxoria varia]|nr:MAG: hypothetical protein M1831_002263 [Alyxoria varia]